MRVVSHDDGMERGLNQRRGPRGEQQIGKRARGSRVDEVSSRDDGRYGD